MGKRIVIFSAFYEPFMSGAEQMAKEAAERLGKRHKITLITARLDKALPREEAREAFRLVRVGIGHKQIDKILYPLLAPIKARQFKPEIIHAIMESYAGGALVLAKRLMPEARTILTLQSGDLDDPKKQETLLVKFFFKMIHNAPEKITAISTFLGKRAECLGVDPKRISIIPNGVDLSQIPQGISKIPDRVICVARLSWEKGLDGLIKAWPAVVKERSGAKLVLVGEGDKRGEIEKMISESALQGSVELTGNLPHGKVLEEISRSEVFICPSLAEGLGIVFIEGQACGVPVIGTRVGGIPDVIQDGKNGLLIRPKNPEDISAAILKFLKDKDLAGRMSAEALETVKKYNWTNIIEEINGLYEREGN